MKGKKSNLVQDRSNPASVKIGAGPFETKFSNNRPLAKSGGSAHESPAGKLSPKKLAGVGRGK